MKDETYTYRVAHYSCIPRFFFSSNFLRRMIRSNLRERSRNIRRRGMGDQKKGKEEAEGCCASCLAMYAARVVPRDVYAKTWAGLSLPSGNNADGKRGGALAYCLKLLIGLRTDCLSTLCSLLVSLSLSLFLNFPFSLPPSTFPFDSRISASSSSLFFILPDFLLSPGPSKRRRGCCGWSLRKVSVEFQRCTIPWQIRHRLFSGLNDKKKKKKPRRDY